MIKGAGGIFSLFIHRGFYPLNNRSFSHTAGILSKTQQFLITRTINAPAADVYDVVSDISEYKKFMKYCNESFVDKRDPETGKPSEAGLRVGFQHYDETFVCQIRCLEERDNNYTVVANSLTHSLFKALQTKWSIKPHQMRPGVTEAILCLEFQFKNGLYNNVASIFGKSVTELVMKSFERRIFTLRRQNLKGKPADAP
ncbi:LAME_0D10264g1_1 [Lachancea meyersii CBS 8951]|uniref:LAME_0D10264g1_1 n=1 Tax=Lachancea meyersii CBS 8951 TaxID=1266667 RepID=A0A1G4JBM5_9SACH|nr:LAME_0D10264g1_1 [Lachancea meyersii CBS 8951]